MKQQLDKTYYDEAMRYIYNAEELLEKADPKDGLRKINMKVLKQFVSLYSEIHIGIYYEDNAEIKAVKESFKDAKQFIGHLKPNSRLAEY